MAKNRIEVAELVLKTTDGDTFKIFGQKAKKATKEVENMGRASQSTDRRIKGVTEQSSNATKNFSKQAQTMQGGIVAVYAQIAANVFAVSAAYQFLKSSMETRNLIEGQKAFGAITGVAYKTLTHDLQEATQGMLDFKAAASSVAIGTASGLSASQLTQLGAAAKNASLALGRDLTDSFNRLIRGVTKAEPELLDELGIVLRLENATRDYAMAVGKARDDLNAYERTQAVLNDVLAQAEQKFGRITQLMDPDAFALGQLTKEIDDLVLGFQRLMVSVLLPFIQFFKDNAMALVAAIGLFVAPIIDSMLPDLDKALKANAKEVDKTMSRMTSSFREAKQESQTAFAGMRKLTTADSSEAMAGLDKLGVQGKGAEIMEDGKKTGYKELTKRQIAAYRRAIREKKGIYMKFNREEQLAFKRHLATQEAIQNKSSRVRVGIVKRSQMAINAVYNTGVAAFAAAERAKLAIAKATAVAMNAVMSIAGVLGVIAMVVAAGKALFDFFMKGTKEAQELRKETEKVKSRLEGINDELSGMVSVRDQGLVGLLDGISQSANALQSADVVKTLSNYRAELAKSQLTAKEFNKTDLGYQFLQQARNIEALAPEMRGYAADLAKTGGTSKQWGALAGEIINGAKALERFAENNKAVNKQIEATIGKMAKLPFQDIIKPLQAAIDDFADGLDQINARLKEIELANTQTALLGSNFFRTDSGGRYDKGLFGGTKPYVETRINDLYMGDDYDSPTYTMTDYKGRKQDVAALRANMPEFQKRFGGDGGRETIGLMMDRLNLDSDGWGVADEVDLDDMSLGIDDLLTRLVMLGDNAEILKNTFGMTVRNAEAIAEATKDADDEAKKLILQNTRNQNLLTNMLDIQKQLLDLEDKKIKAQKTLAMKGVGSGKALATAKAVYKQEQQTFKEEKARSDVKVANTYKELELNKLRDQLVMDGLDTKEALLMTEEQLIEKAGDGYQTSLQAISNADRALDNAISELDLQGQITKNSKRQLELDKLKIDIQFARLANMSKELELAQDLADIDNRLTTSTKFGFAAAEEQFTERGNRITANQNINTNKRTAALDSFSKRDPMTGGAIGLGLTSAEEVLANLSQDDDQYQEKHKLLTEIINLEREGTKLQAQQVAYDQEQANFATNKLAAENEVLNFKREQTLTLNPAQQLYEKAQLEHLTKYGNLTNFNKEKVAELAVEQANLNIEMELMDGIQNTLSNGFVSMFQALADGSKSFEDSMKDLTKSVLADLAAMYLKAAALKFMLAFMPGGGAVVDFLANPSGRYGGIMSPSGKSFGYGGVASGPQSGYQATLHGTEAVVPLGNDRSIPVEMRGGGSSNVVNVSVNVSGSGQSSMSSNGGGNLEGMGRQIGALVQQHLQQEMRPGGILNSQGNRGR